MNVRILETVKYKENLTSNIILTRQIIAMFKDCAKIHVDQIFPDSF